MTDQPRAIDQHLVPRVSVATAAKYMGRSPRWVQREIAAGRLEAIDTSAPGARRPCWSIAIHHLRERICRAELQAERRLAEANATEPNISDMGDSRGG
jgi:hypothetical protein